MDIINTIFRFIDCFIVVGLVLYGIKKRLIPMIEKIVREYGVFIYNLESDCKNLQLQIQSISENIQDQDRHFHLLQDKFAVWQQRCHEQVLLQQAAREKIDDGMKQRYQIRSEYVKRDRVLKQELPHILQDVTQALQTKYQGHQMQKEYIDQLVITMKVKP